MNDRPLKPVKRTREGMTKTSGTESTPSIMTPTRDKKHPNSYSTSTSPLQYQHQSSEQSFQTNKQGNNNENNLINRGERRNILFCVSINVVAGFRQLIWDCLEKV